MNNLRRAVEILKGENHTCVLCKGETVFASDEKGIKPMVNFIDSGILSEGFCAADKIVGKAAAMLFCLAKVKAVYAEVMSRSGLEFLQKHNIICEYETLTDKIINRKGDGICPMEKAVAEIDDCNEAFIAIKETMKKLQKGFTV